MIESSMYFGIGLLLGAIIGLVLIPIVHGRAVRLTTRRLHAILPESMADVQAEKDLLRAQFAMSTRRLEITVEQLKNTTTSQAVEISKRDDLIKRLNFERDSQEVEIIALKTQIEALKERTAIIPYQVEMNDDPERLVNKSLGEPQLNRSGPFAAEVASDAKQLVSEESS